MPLSLPEQSTNIFYLFFLFAQEPETLSVKPDLGDLHEQLSMKPDLADLELTVKPDLTDLEPLRAGCPGSIPKYWCKFCGKSFEFPSALRKHIVVHTRNGLHLKS